MQLVGDKAAFTGIYALDKVDLFNILCIPDATRASVSNPSVLDSAVGSPNDVWSPAMDYCKKRRAFLLIDPPPSVNDIPSALAWKTSGLTVTDPNGADISRALRIPDPLNQNALRTFAPCGVMAGVYSTTNSNRNVWKAPAGTEATLSGVQKLVYTMTDAENGELNPLGLNCLRELSDLRLRQLGRTHAGRVPTRWHRNGNTFRCGVSRCSWKKVCIAACNGWCSSRTPIRYGRRSGST